MTCGKAPAPAVADVGEVALARRRDPSRLRALPIAPPEQAPEWPESNALPDGDPPRAVRDDRLDTVRDHPVERHHEFLLGSRWGGRGCGSSAGTGSSTGAASG